MTSRRAGVAPGLLDRVRWGNVGRLAALLAGVILLVTGPHGCGPARGIGDRRLEIGDASPQPPALPSAVKAAPAVTAPSVIPSLPAVRKKKQEGSIDRGIVTGCGITDTPDPSPSNLLFPNPQSRRPQR